MTRITVDVNDEWLEAAREVLGTDTKVSTINEALHSFALRKQAVEIVAAFESVPMDFTGSDGAWRFGGGRDLSQLEREAREGQEPRERQAPRERQESPERQESREADAA